MRKDRTDQQTNAANPTRRPQFTVIVILAAAAVLLAVTFWPRHRPGSEAALSPSSSETGNSASTAGVEDSRADLQKVQGRWMRPDGGYILDIRKVDEDGQLDAGYFNPDPIRVSSALARKDGSATKVLVELNDVNYPGCKYNLTYIPGKDVLVGTYFQAAMQETFDVGFERVK